MNIGSSVSETTQSMELSDSEFQRVRRLIFDYCGINLHEGKVALVRARLMKRMRKVGMRGFKEYLDYMEADTSGSEFLSLVDVLTTNKTSFFRENQHFAFIREEVIPAMAGRSVKWWSAGCSSGEEPITMAVTLLEEQRNTQWNSVKILATDIDREILRKAKTGVYQARLMNEVPKPILGKYFNKAGADSYRVGSQVSNMITFGRINLQEPWPLKGPFHVIMCRNVMIYFNRQTQQRLVSRFYDLLEPGGYLFLGHSESISGGNHGFVNIRPAVYRKVK